MLYLWVICKNHGRGWRFASENWSGRVTLPAAFVGMREDVHLPLMISEGAWSMTPPEGFAWEDAGEATRQLKHGDILRLRCAEAQLTVLPFLQRREDTAFRKLAWPAAPVSIGSDSDNMIRYTEELVTHHHGEVLRQGNMFQYTDHSSNGSYVNGMLVRHQTVGLKAGDCIDILPCLRLIVLDSCLAVIACEHVTISDMLRSYEGRQMEKGARSTEDSSVVVEYHRAPRQIQQPDHEPVVIEPPLERERRREMPTWLTVGPSFTMILPMLMSTLVSQRSMASSLVMIGTSSAMAIMWGTFNRRYQAKEAQLNESNRQKICKQYYAEMEELLAAATDRERKRLALNHLSVGECLNLPASNEHRLWERLPSHEDFLTIRLGVGEQPLPAPIQVSKLKISLVDDVLRHEPQRLQDTYSMMHDVPIVLDTARYQIVGVLGSKAAPWLMQSMVVQLAANHSYHDVRIAVIHDRTDEEQWAFAKWLPHVFASDDRTLRMVASEDNAIQEILSHLDSVLSVRRENLADQDGKEASEEHDMTGKIPWYVIFCTDPALLENQPIMRFLTTPGLGFTLVLQTTSMEMLPKECTLIIESKSQLGAVYHADGTMTGVQFETADEQSLRRFARNLAPFRIKELVEDAAIPSLVTFLETYHVRNVDDLDVRRFWNENHAWQSVKSCLGLKSGGVPFNLDISDKNHGPHGLIAGTTGAGKSVLLQSFILSLAINYSPTEVQFILIDYKGGGTSEDFKPLPHAAGVIDSLQGERTIYRALASIKGEIQRREEMFKNGGVNNIDDYMKLFNNDPSEEPLGHLIIIVDEFAELKKEQPEFMTELVSAARVGRSLGLHLVLATQKPSGSVSAEIEANTRFRICLRVASRGDSNEMLKRPEAAYLKGMGRCYVQVGSDEVFEQVQTSYSGAAYSPEALRPEEEPRMLNEAGQPIRFKKKKKAQPAADGKQVKQETELDAVMRKLQKTCEQFHFPKARRMWLNELGAALRLTDVPLMKQIMFADGDWPCRNEEDLIICYGLADDVAKQRYLPATINLLADKNVMLGGLAGSGRTTALQTMAVSLALRYTPAQVQIYVFSLTSHKLACLAALPHVGDIVYDEELDEQVRLMELIYAECERRKKLFRNRETDNFIQYNRAVLQGDKVPAIVVLVDQMQQLRAWSDQRLDDKLQLFYDMLRSASSLGVFFILSAYGRSELPGKYQPFVHGVALRLNERADYADMLGCRIPPEWSGIQDFPGRGVMAVVDKEAKKTYVYETQTAVYEPEVSDEERAKAVTALGKTMSAAWTGCRPMKLARIPEKPNMAGFLQEADAQKALAQVGRLPLGYVKKDASVYALDLREFYSGLICGPRKSGKTTLLKCLAMTFQEKRAEIYMVGSMELAAWANQRGMHGVVCGDKGWKETFDGIMALVRERSGMLGAAADLQARRAMLAEFTPVVMLVDDLDRFMDAYEKEKDLVSALRFFCVTDEKIGNYGVYTYAAISHVGVQSHSVQEPVMTMKRARRGLMLQGRLSECDPFSLSGLSMDQRKKALPVGEAFLVNEQEVRQLVLPIDEPAS